MSDRMWKAPELADYLGVSRNTLSGWRVKGMGPRFVRVGRLVRYREQDVDNWLESHASTCAAGGDGHA